jgi:hypothetical protein
MGKRKEGFFWVGLRDRWVLGWKLCERLDIDIYLCNNKIGIFYIWIESYYKSNKAENRHWIDRSGPTCLFNSSKGHLKCRDAGSLGWAVF